MNKFIYVYALVLVALMSACSKTMDILSPDFEVELTEETVKVGEEVTFHLGGSANIVTFYSGEVGNEYLYRESRPLELSDPLVSFRSNANYGAQEGQMSIWVSTEFDGDYTPDGIAASMAAGEWIDITEHFKLSSRKAANGNYNGETVSSGTFNLSEIITEEMKGIYFAYRNKVGIQSIAGTHTQWTMSSFLIDVNTLLGRQELVNQASAGWNIIATGGTDPGREPSIAATSIFFMRNTTREVELDNWAITKKIEFEDVDMGPDFGVPIKSYADPQLTEFKHTYTTPGTYVATFVASNVNAEGEKNRVKQVKVVVEP